MKLGATTFGSEGDTRPIAALGRARMDAGHEIILPADGGTLETARQLGVPHAMLAGSFRISRDFRAAGTPEVKERATAVGVTMRAEDGLKSAVEIIQALLAR